MPNFMAMVLQLVQTYISCQVIHGKSILLSSNGEYSFFLVHPWNYKFAAQQSLSSMTWTPIPNNTQNFRFYHLELLNHEQNNEKENYDKFHY